MKKTVFLMMGFCMHTLHAADFDADGAYADYKARTFIKKNDATNWATAINNLVGAYVTKTGDVINLHGKSLSKTESPTQVDLKDRDVFRELVSSSQNVEASIVNFFKFSRDKKYLDELIINDLISVSDNTVNLDTCVANHLTSFTSTTTYWCISAITLSKISTNKYSKNSNLAKGSYGVATADGTFQNDKSKSSVSFTANVTLVGPIVDGKLYESNPPVSKDGSRLILKSLGTKRRSGLEGKTIELTI